MSLLSSRYRSSSHRASMWRSSSDKTLAGTNSESNALKSWRCPRPSYLYQNHSIKFRLIKTEQLMNKNIVHFVHTLSTHWICTKKVTCRNTAWAYNVQKQPSLFNYYLVYDSLKLSRIIVQLKEQQKTLYFAIMLSIIQISPLQWTKWPQFYHLPCIQ